MNMQAPMPSSNRKVHPGIIWLMRAETKIFLVRMGEETVEGAIMDLAPAFYDLVHPACDCARDIYERMERNYPPVPPRKKGGGS